MTLPRRAPKDEAGRGKQKGLLGYVLAWILGIPIPVLIVVAILHGCT